VLPSAFAGRFLGVWVGEATLLENSRGAVRVLADELVNQIAAGEVVERPASIVKELVENSLDAEATRVDVVIRDGGSRFISVADDGVGMSRADAELAFERHATSKISAAEDLAAVGTLGFRGEALPSIASVARVRMRTRRAEDAVGVEVSGEGHGIERVAETACAAGTRVEVADLFGLVPARQKFLKTPVTEGTHTVRWLERIALARPDVRFSLERDGRPALLFLPTRDARERMIAALPASVGERLQPLEGRSEHASVRGFTTPTDVLRGSTADIHVFVNGRPVRDRLLLHVVRDAYRDALPPGRHPAAVLYLTVDPGEVDVNVHPAKWEVRFRDPGEIRRLVRDAIHRAIAAPGHRAHERPAPTGFVREAGPPADFALGAPSGAAAGLTPFGVESAPVFGAGAADAAPPVPFRAHRLLGQVLGTYLVLERPGALVLVDVHAAHERVLFERMRDALLAGKLERQALLIPVRIDLPRSAADALEQAAASLERAGFDLEVGETTAAGSVRVTLRSVPAALVDRTKTDWGALLSQTAAELLEPGSAQARGGIEGALHDVLATAACHSAVRKGDRLEPREADALLEALDDSIWVPNCPHGRPIALTLGETELERRILRR